ncbi:MAG: hypothetical protein AAB482_02665 [Patescibacteria group bacterium]
MPTFSDIKKIERKPALQHDRPISTTKHKAPDEPRPQKIKQEITRKNISIAWKAPEYVYYKKSPDWYWSLGILGAALIGVALWQNNFLFALITLVGTFAIALYAVRKPRTIEIKISIKGVEIDNTLYPYESLKSFWIFYRPGGVKELSLMSEKMFMPRIAIPIGDIDPVELRDLLIQSIPETAQEESFADAIARWLGF